MQAAVRYTITPANPGGHLFELSCEVTAPDPDGQRFSLPAWIPGSYMIREFARNIVRISAESEGRTVALEKCDKHSWKAAPVAPGQSLLLIYEVYAWDLSVRAAHLDQTHGFFNGTSVFLRAEGREHLPCMVDIRRPEGDAGRGWKVATTLSPAKGKPGAAWLHGFGLYRAEHYDELVDHPVEMGSFTLARFEAGGVPHEVAITGRHDCDLARLTADLARICDWQIALFGAPPPMPRYLFLTMVVGDGYGGLEHRASTALIASREDLPYRGMKGSPEGYRRFLGLCSHEYFHTWNVKRIKPAAFEPYDLSRENYTRLLWAFEGITSYYDDLALVRSGVIGLEDYLEQIGKTVSGVLRGSGRFKQSVAESSFDAWTKYYRQDENAPNAIVSYYTKGSLVALALDLQLRAASAGRQSLDEVMRALWQRNGQTRAGVPEDGIYALVEELGGTRLARWLRKAVEGTDDLPLARLLKQFGVDHAAQATQDGPWLGLKLAGGNGAARVANVYDDGPAQAAGVSAGDVLLALDGIKLDGGNLDKLLERRSPGEVVRVHAFRRDELMEFELTLDAPPKTRISLKPAARPAAAALQLRKGWLGA
jgi:predicted metalloprotease with PDZ domain